MLNLPWYSWFNVIALPIVMICLWAEYLVADYKPWTRRLVTFQTLACIATISLYWNASLFKTLVPINYLLFLLVALLYMRTIGGVMLECIFTARHKLKQQAVRTAAPTPIAACSVAELDFESDLLDLDDEGETAQHKNVANNLPTLFDRSSSAGDKIKSVFSILGVSLEEEVIRNSKGYLSTIVIFGLFMALVLTPPLWMSIKLLQ